MYSSEQDRATGAENVLRSDLNKEQSRALGVERDLSNNLANEISRAKLAEFDVLNNLGIEIIRAKGAEVTLTTNLSNEISRAKGAEFDVSNNLGIEITRAKGAELTLTTNLSNEIINARAAETKLGYNIVRTQLVPLNSLTTGGEKYPKYIPPSSTNQNVDGWSFTNTVKGNKVQWGTGFSDVSGNNTLAFNQVNQIYFTIQLNKDTSSDDLPFFTAYSDVTLTPTYSISQKIQFVGTQTLTKGLYTFVVDLTGNNITPAAISCFGSKIVKLSYNIVGTGDMTRGSFNFKGATPLSWTPNWVNGGKINYFTIQTNSASNANTVDFILTDLYIEVNGQNPNIPPGTYNHKFSNTVVANDFLYTSINNLYQQLYKSDIQSTVFPGSASATKALSFEGY